MSILSKFLSRFGIPETHIDVPSAGDFAKSIHEIATAHEVHAALETRGNMELARQLGDASDAYFAALDNATSTLGSAGAAVFVALLNGVGSDIAPAYNRMRDLTSQGQEWLAQNAAAPPEPQSPPLA
jgi:hypothetical protein